MSKGIDKIFLNNKIIKDHKLAKKLNNDSKGFINMYISSVSVYLSTILKDKGVEGDVDKTLIDDIFKTL